MDKRFAFHSIISCGMGTRTIFLQLSNTKSHYQNTINSVYR